MLALALSLALGASGLTLQDTATLRQRLDPGTYAALLPVMEAARRDALPLRALEAKALEGAAKRRLGPEIVAAVTQLAADLKAARELLGGSAAGPRPADGDVVAAAEALRRGVPPKEIAELRRAAPPATRLDVPLVVLGALVERGIPADEARRVLEHLLAAGIPAGRLADIPARVDIALRVGAPPVPALHSALQGLGIPVPPGKLRPGPPRKPGRPPPGPPGAAMAR